MMQKRPSAILGFVGVIVTTSWTMLNAGQLQLAPVGTHGQTITPVYEGWHQHPDGTLSVSWGYSNRNSEEILEIPVGAENHIELGGPDRGQPTSFLPRRQRGVFAVVVPTAFGDNEVHWTLSFRGDTQTIPGHLHRDWLLDALGGAANGDGPPVVQFAENDPEYRGPDETPEGPLTATVGTPLPLSVWVSDDGITLRRDQDREGEAPPLVRLAWYLHQGPASVNFTDEELEISENGPTRTDTTVTLTEPGEYLPRVLATGRSGGGGSQCCWTNAFVRVNVS